MADFLTIHGIPVLVRDRTWKQVPVFVGDRRGRTQGARLIDGSTRRVWQWSGASPLLDYTEAAPLIGLINGDGHVFSFDADLYSSKGLIQSAGLVPTLQATNVKFGANAAQITSANTATYSPDYNGLDQTILVWRRPGAGSFDHYGITRTAGGTIAEVKNGVAGSFTTSNWITFGATNFVLQGKNDAGTNTTVQYDDLVVLPFLLTTAQIAAVFAQTRAWADLPNLNVSGDGIAGGGTNYVVAGRVGKIDFMQAQSPLDGTWKTDNVVFDFTFEEV